MEYLRLYGIDIVGVQTNHTYSYQVVSKQFELAELKLLVDSIQSAKFITEKKSTELIRKIEGLASEHEARLLHRQVYVSGRVKTMNERIYYSVDVIHEAINTNKNISFQYFNWTVDKQMEMRHDGKRYEVSPWALSWDDENYYLIAYDECADLIKHFRVDKMLNTGLTINPRQGKYHFKEFNMADYTKKMFNMFDGEEENVKLLCDNSIAGIIIDRFGMKVPFIKVDQEHFTATVRVCVSRQFLAWIMSLGDRIKITGPDNVIDMINNEINRLTAQYKS